MLKPTDAFFRHGETEWRLCRAAALRYNGATVRWALSGRTPALAPVPGSLCDAPRATTRRFKAESWRSLGRNELDRDFVLLARCDARGAAGGSLEGAIQRGKAYRAAGVDVMFFEAFQSMGEIRTAIAEVGPPIYFSTAGIPQGERPSHAEMARLGIANAHYWLLRPLRNYPTG